MLAVSDDVQQRAVVRVPDEADDISSVVAGDMQHAVGGEQGAGVGQLPHAASGRRHHEDIAAVRIGRVAGRQGVLEVGDEDVRDASTELGPSDDLATVV